MQREIAATILAELSSRLRYLVRVDLAYLTLDRLARTLSGGEAQRIELSNALGANLVDTLYVLDEPTIGLHPEIATGSRGPVRPCAPRQHARDRRTRSLADQSRGLGRRPRAGAGTLGGHLLWSGSGAELVAPGGPDTDTARYLRGELRVTRTRRKVTAAHSSRSKARGSTT